MKVIFKSVLLSLLVVPSMLFSMENKGKEEVFDVQLTAEEIAAFRAFMRSRQQQPAQPSAPTQSQPTVSAPEEFSLANAIGGLINVVTYAFSQGQEMTKSLDQAAHLGVKLIQAGSEAGSWVSQGSNIGSSIRKAKKVLKEEKKNGKSEDSDSDTDSSDDEKTEAQKLKDKTRRTQK